MEKEDKIKSITLRVAIFFGLTTFTLCIAIFYIEAILDDRQDVINQKDSLIEVMQSDMNNQLSQIQENETEILILKEELKEMRTDLQSNSEE